jgi:hypothetical protein
MFKFKDHEIIAKNRELLNEEVLVQIERSWNHCQKL